ncbi:cysteine-rich CWC family protein [Thiohalocapsa marina]|uniref:Cysteine-rich CWC family protein n=1 Tax=Thiohalocapsa marina TaxID=424902 RepID=A0A5M8FE53_9GAMM|nr:cysteine-rich CWC family protein [Thiohalocapsa marina]KAA6182190.1 cysteine-rich CWC family protein [Thiohalocapsa marina]
MTWNEPLLQGTKRCPRCGAAFECKVDDLRNCDCVAVKVSLPVLKHLQHEYEDCLCPACLRELAQEQETNTT